jgi:transposase
LLPVSSRGRKRLDDRRVLNGIVWKFRTGTAWRDVPERYGPWATLHTRFRRWAADGTFERMLRAAQVRADAAGDIDWLVSVDSTLWPTADPPGGCDRSAQPLPLFLSIAADGPASALSARSRQDASFRCGDGFASLGCFATGAGWAAVMYRIAVWEGDGRTTTGTAATAAHLRARGGR